MPLLRITAVAWIVGAIVARLIAAWPMLGLGLGCVAGVLGLLAILAGARRLGLVGLSVGIAVLVTPPLPRATATLFDGRPWDFIAHVDGTPRRADDKITLPLALEAVRRGGAPLSATGRIRFTAPHVREALAPGDRVMVHARIAPPLDRCNPGACDGLWRAAADDMQGSVSLSSSELAFRIDEAPMGLRARLWRLREALRARIEAVIPEREAVLVSALVLGERGALLPQLETDFRALGITHLLSVSGLHLAFAAGLLFALARSIVARVAPRLGALHPRDRWAALASLPIVLGYAILTGAEVATLRAAFVVAYAFFAIVGARRLRGADALSFAALALLLDQPARLFDVSFQLSFVAAVATLVVATHSPRDEAPPRLASVALLVRLARAAWLLMRVSLAATLATAPLTAWWFAEVAPMGVVTNVVAVPLTELVIVPLGIAGAILASVWSPLGRLPLLLSGFATFLLTQASAYLAPWSPVFRTGAPSWACVTVCVFALLWIARAPGLRRVAVACVAVAVVVAGEALADWCRPSVEVCFLDVGQGDAAVVLLPDHRALVVDGGPGQGEAAARTVGDYLARRGVRRIALMVLSHPHPDHSGGLPGLFARFSVDELWWNGQLNADPATRALLRRAGTFGVPVVAPHGLDLGAVHLEVLGPHSYTGEPGTDPLASENDNSLVVRLDYAGRSLLFAGDIEAEAEEALVARRPRHIDVLKVPHHGSRTSSTEELLRALRPSLAIASLAAGNRYRFPHPDVVERYRALTIPLYRTDRDGAVTVRFGHDGTVQTSCARPGGCLAE